MCLLWFPGTKSTEAWHRSWATLPFNCRNVAIMFGFFIQVNHSSLRVKVTKWNFPGYELNLRNPYIPERPVKSVMAFSVYLCHTLYQLYTMLVRHDIDIVNIHYPISSGLYFTFLRKLLRFKLVISVHGTDLLPKGIPEDRYSKPLQLLMNSADWLVAPSQSMLDAVLTKFPRLQTKASAIHNAVDMTEFEPDGPGELQRGQHILCVALHHPRKAIDVLIKAFKIFSQTHTEVELWLVGDGPVRGQLEDLVHQLGLTEQVKFLGLPRQNRREEAAASVPLSCPALSSMNPSALPYWKRSPAESL